MFAGKIERKTSFGIGVRMASKICPNCGKKIIQQFIGLQYCKCATSWKKDMGFFERNGDMMFTLERKKVGNKTKQSPVIR